MPYLTSIYPAAILRGKTQTGDTALKLYAEVMETQLWRHQVHSLDVRVDNGGLFRLKGYPEGMPNVNLKIDVRRPAVTITPYAAGRSWFFHAGSRLD